MQKTIYKKVGVASAIMTVSIFLSRVLGLVRESVIAHMAGAGKEVDAYQVAFLIPEILNHILASGFLSITFIPIFALCLSQNREDEGWKIFSTILTCLGSLMGLLILIAMIFTPELMAVTGFKDPATKAQAVRMTRIIMPAQFFFFAGGLLMAVQYAKEKFILPALASPIYNLGIIAGGIVLSPWLGVEGFSWGVLAGAFVGNFVVQVIGAKQAGMRFYPRFDFKHPDLKKYILLTLPLMVGLTMTFSTEIFYRFFGSYLAEGAVAGLNYSFRIMFVLVALFGQAVGVASYPFMARLVAEKKLTEMNALLNRTLRYISLVIPFSILLMVLRRETILMVFQRGKFDAAATDLTSAIMVFILIGAVAFAAQTVVARGFYAMQNTIFPAVFGTLAVLLSIPLYVILTARLGVIGLALALSISAIFQVTLLYVLWNRRSKNRESRTVYLFFLKIILISIPLGIGLEKFRLLLAASIDTGTFSGSLAVSGITGLVFAGLFLAAGYVFRIQEIGELGDRLVKRFKAGPQ
jgi:putative peptidoglycan lipid II flippase